MRRPKTRHQFLDCVKVNFDHILETCREHGEGHRLKMGKLKTYVMVDGDASSPKTKSCDCIILAVMGSQIVVAVIELKGRLSDVGDIVKKLKNMSKLATEMIQKCNRDGLPVEFFPILYHSGVRGRQKDELGKIGNRIGFSQEKYPIIIKEYKIPLTDIVGRF